jgi:hypothetical protein
VHTCNDIHYVYVKIPLNRLAFRLMVLRCFLWIVSELVDGWYSQFELAGSLVGCGSEVDEVFKSPRHSFR